MTDSIQKTCLSWHFAKIRDLLMVLGASIISRRILRTTSRAGECAMKAVSVGDKAPDFELVNQSGDKVRLSDFLGKKNVVLYFYPKDFTSGCTKEACAFRDSYEEFKDIGAEVLGVSSDTQETHGLFSVKLGLPFQILSDGGGKVRKLYGVPSSLGMIPGRVTYVIDREGIVRYIFNSQINAEKHMQESLRIVKSLQ
jgi:peroxiredoxin Q/BCP